MVLGVVTGRCDGRTVQWCWGLSQGGVMAEQCSGVGGCHREV